jgi:predicted 2-oxoglutarate/Fe(II)-dependent dioxygenase YbiX
VRPFALGLVRERLALEETWQQPPVKRLSDRPKLGAIDSLLSADECRLLMAAARPRLSHSHTLDPQSGAKSFNAIRTSQDASFDPLQEDLALRLVQARMATAAGVELVFAEPLIVLRYAPGEQYHPHRDYLPSAALADNRPQAGDRAGTICAYLNDVEAGGETVFPAAGVTIAPTAGSAIAFANLQSDGSPDPDSLHAGLPVERGEKWLATLWIRQGPYRDF